MLIPDNINNIYSLSKDYLNYLQYDKECIDKNILDKMLLLTNIECLGENLKTHDITTINKLEKISNILGKKCRISYRNSKSLNVNVILDDTDKYYSDHLDCIPLPLWQVIAKKIKFNYNIKTHISSYRKEDIIIKTIIKSELSNKKIKNLNFTIKDINSNFDNNLKITTELESKIKNLGLKISIKEIDKKKFTIIEDINIIDDDSCNIEL